PPRCDARPDPAAAGRDRIGVPGDARSRGMTSEQFETFLAQAGVDAGAVGDAERLLLPEPQVDEARTAPAGMAFAPPALLSVRSDALSAAGIEAGFDEDARTLV